MLRLEQHCLITGRSSGVSYWKSGKTNYSGLWWKAVHQEFILRSDRRAGSFSALAVSQSVSQLLISPRSSETDALQHLSAKLHVSAKKALLNDNSQLGRNFKNAPFCCRGHRTFYSEASLYRPRSTLGRS